MLCAAEVWQPLMCPLRGSGSAEMMAQEKGAPGGWWNEQHYASPFTSSNKEHSRTERGRG